MLLSALTISLSAFLLFQVQPMIAKMILPWFGGSAAVWITAMLFFQTVLLAGYLYSHGVVKNLAPRKQALLHGGLIVLSLVLLPITPSASWKPVGGEDPVLKILGALLTSVGLPYFLLSTTSPLVQAWFSRMNKAALPYKLFGLSNLASLIGLVAYPFLVEPNATLRFQSIGWSLGYAAFAVVTVVLAMKSSRTDSNAAAETSSITETENVAPPAFRQQALWVALSACGSMLLLAITNHLTQNVASIPFLWVIPLSIYLLTFILTFDLERLYHRTAATWLFIAAMAGMAYGLVSWNSQTSLKIVIPAYSAGLFFTCLFCHGELVRRKPHPRHLTSFYLMLSIGGALGGVLIGLAAPRMLTGYFELPITLCVVVLLSLFLLDYRKWRFTVAVGWTVTVVVAGATVSYLESYREASVVMVRNFYGGLRVHEYEKGTEDELRVLSHGTVNHGMQLMAQGRRREHIAYYGPESGISMAMAIQRKPGMRAGVLGLGAGSLAAFGEKGDTFRFYEINPLVETLARKEFTYLADTGAKIDVVLGDGRLSLEREPDQKFDVLVADAFSGDAIPAHLITKQALEVYFRHLAPRGTLALNITNSHLDLAPVIAGLAEALGKHAVIVQNAGDEDREVFHSRWALLSSKPFTSKAILAAGKQPEKKQSIGVWTDDFNDLFRILKY